MTKLKTDRILFVTVLAMVALALLSIGWADDRSSAVKEALKWLELWLVMVVVCDLARTARAARVVTR